jgi:hypothetical protein
VAALVFEAVTTTTRSRRAVQDAVDMLAARGLLERSPDGLTAHPGRLLAAAEHLGAVDVVTAQTYT